MTQDFVVGFLLGTLAGLPAVAILVKALKEDTYSKGRTSGAMSMRRVIELFGHK